MAWSTCACAQVDERGADPGNYDDLPRAEFEEMEIWAWDFDLLDISRTADVTVIDRAAIEASGSMSIPDILQREANVRFESFSGKASQAQVSLRGFGENSGLRVLVVVDGQRLNRPDMGMIEWQLIPLDDIESIEVIRGGQNVLYGNYALAGVIQINTRRGGQPRTKLSAETGSYGYYFGAIDHAGGQGDWFWDVNVSGLSDEGYRENAETWNRGVSATVGHHFEEHTLSVSGTVTEGYMQFPGPLSYQKFQDDPRQYGYAGDVFAYDSTYLSGLVEARYEGEHSWGASRAQLSVNFRDLEWNFGGVMADNQQYTATFAPRVRVGSQERFVIGGLDLAFSKIDFTSYFQQYRDIVNSEADLSRVTLGPYLFAEAALSERLSVSGGLRYEAAIGNYQNRDHEDWQLDPIWEQGIDIQAPFPTMPNPFFKDPADLDRARSYDETAIQSGLAAEFSLSLELSKAWSVFAGYDRAYRYPVMDEVAAYQGFDQGTSTRPLPFNPDLKPEVGDQFEVGLRYDSDPWDVSATAFWLELENEIAFDTYENINANIGPTRRYGVDFRASYDRQWWGASTQWAWVDARYTGGTFEYQQYIQFTNPPQFNTFRIDLKGNEVPLVPRIHGVSSAWVRPWNPLELTAYYSYFSSRWQGNDYENDNFNGNSEKIPAFGRVDLRASYEFKHFKVFARLNNVLDESYAPLAFRQGFYPAPGREWRLGVNFTF